MRQTLDRLATLLLRFLLPLTALTLPLFFLPITTEFFLINKNLLLLVIGSLALLAWLVRNITRRRIHVSLTPATFPLLLLAATYLASSLIQTTNVYMSLMGRTALVFALATLFLAVTSSQKNKAVLHLTLAALILSASIASLFSLYSYLGLNGSLTGAPAWFTNKNFNPVGGPVPFLTLVLPLLPAILYLAIKSTRWQLKAILLLCSGLVAAASLSQINLLLPGSGNQILILPFAAGWSIAVDIFKNARTALLGTGPETFLSTFTRLRPAYLNLGNLSDSRFAGSSNELFTVLTTVGLLGAFFWLAAFIKPLSAGLKQVSAKKASKELIAALLLTAGAFLANLIVPANPVLLGFSIISLTLVSLSLKLDSNLVKDLSINLSATPVASPDNPYGLLEGDKKGKFELLPWLTTLLLLIPLSIFWYWQGRAYTANLATYQALSLLNTNATESYNRQIQAYNLEPENPYYRLNFSQTSLALANSIAGKKDLTDQDKENVTQLVQQAIREAKKATELAPDNVLAWENLANTYRQLINFAEGAQDWTIASYNQALSLDPNSPRLYLELGGVYYSLKDNDSAQKSFEQAISLKPNWANAHYNLAILFKNKKEYAKALSEMRIVVRLLDPNGKDYQQAQNELKELEKLAPAPSASTKAEPGELTTPTPPPAGGPTSKTKVNLPPDSAPDLPK